MSAELSLPPTFLARALLESHLHAKKAISICLKAPALIYDADLRCRIEVAVDADPYAGPRADTVRRVAGIECEEILQQKLRARGVPFLNEGELCIRGDARTPDAVLPVPLLVSSRVVNWIDSKATFGDPATHTGYASQFSSYVNRFDNGLVIYWLGYDESINTDPRIVLLDNFPSNDCELMTCIYRPYRHYSLH